MLLSKKYVVVGKMPSAKINSNVYCTRTISWNVNKKTKKKNSFRVCCCLRYLFNMQLLWIAINWHDHNIFFFNTLYFNIFHFFFFFTFISSPLWTTLKLWAYNGDERNKYFFIVNYTYTKKKQKNVYKYYNVERCRKIIIIKKAHSTIHIL